MHKEIYIVREAGREGPFSASEISDLLASGEVNKDTKCLVGDEELEMSACEVEKNFEAQASDLGEAKPDDLSERAQRFLEGEDLEEKRHEPPKEILYRGRPAWLSFWRSIIISIVALGAGIATWSYNGWFLFGSLVIALAFYGYVCFTRSLRLYLVTRRRVEVIYGFISKSSHEVRIRDIRTINVKKIGLKGLIGVGTVEFSTAGGDEIEVAFKDVFRANRVKALVRKLQDDGA